jgi:integrase
MTVTVKYRSVSIQIHPWKRQGRDYWRFKAGDKMVVRANIDDAKKAATDHAKATYRGSLDLSELTPQQVAACQRMIEADPTCALVDEFLVWHGKRAPKKSCRLAVTEFLAVKEAGRGKSHYNVANLTRHLARLPDKNLCDITLADFPAITGSARTRVNAINAWVTFFRWCVRQGYLPYGEATAAERLEKPQVVRSIPSTYTPTDLRALLAAVKRPYLPWLALAAFAGLRTEEVCPDPKSGKSGVAWEDFQWDRDILIIRPETAKTGHRRVVPILPALRSILEPLRASGSVGPHLPPHTPPKGGKLAETTRLGNVIGGWKRNALRHSWISYRAALVGLARTSMEAGNSESEARKSYNDAKGGDEAEEWFGIMFVSQ